MDQAALEASKYAVYIWGSYGVAAAFYGFLCVKTWAEARKAERREAGQ